MQRKNGDMTFVMGRSRSGKTQYVIRMIAKLKAKRILAWDPDSQFCELPGFKRVESLAELLSILRKTPGKAKLAYQVKSNKDFDAFCKLAFNWNLLNPCAVIAEEVADVVSPGKASNGWGILIRRGRKYGVDVFALTQRPQETDKSTLGNCSKMVFFAPNTQMDRDYLVKNIGLAESDIPTENLHYLIRSEDGSLKKGKLTF